MSHTWTGNHRNDKEKWRRRRQRRQEKKYISSFIHTFMTFCLEPRKSTEFFLFVLRISICKFEHLERWSNNKNHVMLTLNRWKKTKIVIFYFHMIWTFFFIRFLGFCLRFSTKKFRCLLLNTLHFSSILNYLALEPDWTCVIFYFDGIDSDMYGCVCAQYKNIHHSYDSIRC